MKKNLLTLGLLAIAFTANSQVLTHIDNTATFFVGEGALLYNGGGLQTINTGKLDVAGNVMIEGASTDIVKTLVSTGGANRTAGQNIVLRFNDPSDIEASTYGQLYINGIAQPNLTAIVDKQYLARKHGTYQQMGLPFYAKPLSTLNTELRPFNTTRWSQKEILKYNNVAAKSDHFKVLSTSIGGPNAPAGTYFMLGSKTLDMSTPPGTADVFTFKGRAVSNGVSATLFNAGNGINYGTNGNNKNSYGERYNTYLQDPFEGSITPWTGTYAKNMYQFGNPYFTNLDLSKIGVNNDGSVAANGDGIYISNIIGVRYDPGDVYTSVTDGTLSTGALFTLFESGIPVGDVGMIIKPMGTFDIKLADNSTSHTLNFDNLRRFKGTSRALSTDYSVSAAKMSGSSVKGKEVHTRDLGSSVNTVKQLGVKGLDINGKEIARAYYVVYPSAVTGHSTSPIKQVTNEPSSLMGTFEEDPANGGYDADYTTKYWLYINQANENDFKGKEIPLALYSSDIKSLKFEVRENGELINDGSHNLSSGLGFYYASAGGNLVAVNQGDVVSVSGTEYGLYYGNTANNSTFAKKEKAVNKPASRTMVAYNPNIDNYIVSFDPKWETADIQVFDMSGKLILSEKEVSTKENYVIDLSKNVQSTYILNIISNNGEKFNTKILR